MKNGVKVEGLASIMGEPWRLGAMEQPVRRAAADDDRGKWWRTHFSHDAAEMCMFLVLHCVE